MADSLYSINTIDAQDICIPKFTLQPLAENSVRHARLLPGEDLCIRIRAWKEEGKALIEVHDNGRECDAQELNHHIRYEKTDLQVSGGFGIRNVDERISLWYNGGGGLVYHNEKDGTLTNRIIHDITQKKTEPDNLGLPVTALYGYVQVRQGTGAPASGCGIQRRKSGIKPCAPAGRRASRTGSGLFERHGQMAPDAWRGHL